MEVKSEGNLHQSINQKETREKYVLRVRLQKLDVCRNAIRTARGPKWTYEFLIDRQQKQRRVKFVPKAGAQRWSEQDPARTTEK